MADTTRSESKPRNGLRSRRTKADSAPPATEETAPDREDLPFGHGILEEAAAPATVTEEPIAEAPPGWGLWSVTHRT